MRAEVVAIEKLVIERARMGMRAQDCFDERRQLANEDIKGIRTQLIRAARRRACPE